MLANISLENNQLGRGKFSVKIIDLERKVNINIADQATLEQALFLRNGELIRGWLTSRPGNLIDRLSRLTSPDALADELYLSVFTRLPSSEERKEISLGADFIVCQRTGERVLSVVDLQPEFPADPVRARRRVAIRIGGVGEERWLDRVGIINIRVQPAVDVVIHAQVEIRARSDRQPARSAARMLESV